MIHVMVSKYDTGPINKKIIEWVRLNLQIKGYTYKLHFCRPYLYDSDIYKEELRDDEGKLIRKEEKIEDTDYILWNPLVAGRNLDFVKQFQRSIVILEKQTLLNEKLSATNMINENLAVNYGFYLMYLNEDEQQPREWKLAVQTDNYLISQKTFLEACIERTSERKEFFGDSNKITKEQVQI